MATLEFLQDLVDRAADGAYVVDENQRIVAWNDAAEKLLGFQAKNVIGMPCQQILGGQTGEGCVVCRRGCTPYTASQRGQLVPSFDVKVRTASGRPRWVNISIIGIAVDTGQPEMPVAVVHFFRDIESKKQAETFATEVAAWARQLSIPANGAQAEPSETPLPMPLSRREHQVLELMAQGCDTDSIAARLVIGKSTVRNHIQRILNKLGVHSRLEAVLYAREHHLLD